MPLSKAKQAEYQRERRARLKLGRTQPIVIPKQELLSNLRDIMDSAMKGTDGKPYIARYSGVGSAEIPIYDPRIHKGGETVTHKGVVMVVKETDADGHEIPDYT